MLLLFFIARYFASMHIKKLTQDNPHILAKLLGFLGALIPIELVGGLWTILLTFLGCINSGLYSTLAIDF